MELQLIGGFRPSVDIAPTHGPRNVLGDLRRPIAIIVHANQPGRAQGYFGSAPCLAAWQGRDPRLDSLVPFPEPQTIEGGINVSMRKDSGATDLRSSPGGSGSVVGRKPFRSIATTTL